jgi:hypothetical protein
MELRVKPISRLTYLRQDIPSAPRVRPLESQIVTEVDNAGTIAPSNQVSFAITAN